MGAGASAEQARTTVSYMLANKPADASDITVRYSIYDCDKYTFHHVLIVWYEPINQDLETARSEIRNLRRIARDFQNQLRGIVVKLFNVRYSYKYVMIDILTDELKKSAGQNNVKKREAVYDKGEQVKGSSTYVPKVGLKWNLQCIYYDIYACRSS